MALTDMSADSTSAVGIALSDAVSLDLSTLIETRLIVQANSGGGKTWALRRLLEQSHGKVQHIVIDVEGSLRTLREYYEYLLLGSETGEVDYPITPANAAMLAIKILEMRTSVIVDLYEFPTSVRQRVVRLLLEALVNAPKPLWHDCLIVVDEAHIFSPQRSNPESKAAVEALCSRGRARGFCALLATQRISKLSKDALGECNNKLIGRASLDVDMKRSNAELEFPSKSQALKKLEPGEFYAFGPAISPTVQKMTIGPVVTTHPQSGSRRQRSCPPFPESLKEVLAMLRALPGGAAEHDDDERERAEEKTQTHLVSRRRTQRRVEKATAPVAPGEHHQQPPGTVLLDPPQVAALLAAKDAEIQQLRDQVELLSKIKVSLDGTVLALTNLPSVLHLDTLNTQVQQATIEGQGLLGPAPAPDERDAPAQAMVVGASRRETMGAVSQAEPEPELLFSERKLLAKLIAQVCSLSRAEKALFTWLIEHDGTEVSSQHLADAVGMDVRVTWSGQTKKLVKIPFVARWGTNKFWYQAVFGTYARKSFPSVADPKTIVEQLVRAAQS